MTDHILPREPLEKSKDAGKGRAYYLDEMTKARLTSSIARLRSVLAQWTQEQRDNAIDMTPPADPEGINDGKHRICHLNLDVNVENAMRRVNIGCNAFAEDLLADADFVRSRPEWANALKQAIALQQ